MKVLITALPGYGHLCPLIPLALAVRQAGHQVAFATSDNMAGAVIPGDIPVFGAGPAWSEAEFSHDTAERAHDHIALPLYKFLETVVVPQMLADIDAHIDSWQPDIIVSNEYERTGCVLAESRRIPFVLASSGPRISRELRRQWHGPLYSAARRSVGLAVDPAMAYALDWLHLCFMPEEYSFGSGAAYRAASNEWGVRPQIFEGCFGNEHGDLPAASDVPTILCTFGSVFNKSAALVQVIVDAFGDAPCRLLIMAGPGFDRRSVIDNADNVSFVDATPLSALLPVVDVCITHGGTSTLATLLSAGKPALLLPQGADQSVNATTCVRLGLGIARFNAVAGVEQIPWGKTALTSRVIRDDVYHLLSEEKFRNNCRKLQKKIHALPDMGAAVGLMEGMVASRRFG